MFGRGDDNDIVLADFSASRNHAEVRKEAGGYVLYDRGSSNGTLVNGAPVSTRPLQSGDQIMIGDELFRFEASADLRPTVQGGYPVQEATQRQQQQQNAGKTPAPVLRVTIAGGGPVGLSLALLLEYMMGARVRITVYEGRWTQGSAGKLVWKSDGEGNTRRLQVVTIQSRQFLRLPPEVQERLFIPAHYTEMWPSGPDSIQDLGPRNIRIAFIEDQLLALAGEKPRIELIPQKFEAAALHDEIASQHVLAICEGGKSSTYEHFIAKFGAADSTLYGIDGEQVADMVLGLRVKSDLPDPMAVLLTVAQNRFLLNSLRGEGFLNMRLTDSEAKEAVGIDPVRQLFTPCIQSGPCLLELRSRRRVLLRGASGAVPAGRC